MVSFFCEHENGLNKLDVNAKIIASIYFLDVSFSFTLNVLCFLSPSKNSSTKWPHVCLTPEPKTSLFQSKYELLNKPKQTKENNICPKIWQIWLAAFSIIARTFFFAPSMCLSCQVLAATKLPRVLVHICCLNPQTKKSKCLNKSNQMKTNYFTFCVKIIFFWQLSQQMNQWYCFHCVHIKHDEIDWDAKTIHCGH